MRSDQSWGLKLHHAKCRAARKIAEAVGCRKYSSPALNGLDELLEERLPKTGFFIEAGANDGYTQSNTYRLERWEGWRGILIEGIPALAEQCRRERPKSKVYACALVTNETTTEVTMRYAGLMSLVTGRKSVFEAAHIKKGLQNQGIRRSYDVKVPARTLGSILAETAPERIDFLSLDLEGFEWDALMGLDLGGFKPETMLIETEHPHLIWEIVSRYYERPEALSRHDYFYRRIAGK